MAHQAPTAKPSNALMLIAAWTLVGLPFGWGVYVTVGNALALFK